MKKILVSLLVAAMLLTSLVPAFAADYGKATIKAVQQALNDAGFDCGTPDGSAGKKTHAAIKAYREANGLTDSEEIDEELLNAMGISAESTSEETHESGWNDEYDDKGYLVSKTYYDKDGKIAVDPKEGYAKVVYVNDENGNGLSDTFYGVDGELVLNSSGYAKGVYEYDDNGNVLSASLYGLDGEPILNYHGYAKQILEYNEDGNLIGDSFYGLNDEPVLTYLGYAKDILEYNENGNLISHTYYGVDGEPVLNSKGYAKLVCVYNEDGNPLRLTYCGLNDEPVMVADGSLDDYLGEGFEYAVMECEYDEKGNTAHITFYDADGNVVLNYL